MALEYITPQELDVASSVEQSDEVIVLCADGRTRRASKRALVADLSLAAQMSAERVTAEEKARQAADNELQGEVDAINAKIPAEAHPENQLADKAFVDGAVSAARTALQGEIDAIDAKIPAQAGADNQLADKDFVNSSIATNTANFIGTFNSLEELKNQNERSVTPNDYAFVIRTDDDGNTVYDRYKYTGTGIPTDDVTGDNDAEIDEVVEETETVEDGDEQWLYEYTVNNSGFTAEQWKAVNSGATAEKINRIKDGNGTDAGLLRLSDAVDGTQGTADATAATPGAVKRAYDKANSMDALIQQLRTTKQDRIPVVDTKDELELEDGEIGIAKEDGLFYQDGDELLNVSGKGTGDGIAFTGTREELEEALKIPEGEEGYIPENALVLITDEDEELSEV